MSGKIINTSGRFRFIDFLVILFFLSVSIVSLCLFRLDLLQTFTLQNTTPVGTVIIKKNTVQRRLSDRVLWDRLARESPVYLWDLIRIPNDSAATLNLKKSSVDLDENTLIRIALAPDGETIMLELREGNISVVSSQDEEIYIDLGGKMVQVKPGTTLSASSGAEGVTVRIHRGSVQFDNNGSVRDISAGSLVSFFANGAERREGTAVVVSPYPYERYLKTYSDPLSVLFSWNKINLEPEDVLRLEISPDRNFNRILYAADGASGAGMNLDSGLWHWRLLFENKVLDSGQITIVNDDGAQLISPVNNSTFTYMAEMPSINFQWTEIEGASEYILEVSSTPDFENLRLRRQTSSTFLTESTLGAGEWHWRVIPVFPSVFTENVNSQNAGSRNSGSSGSFNIELGRDAADNLSLSQLLAMYSTYEPPPEPPPPEPVPAPAPAPRAAAQPASPLPAPRNLRPAAGAVYGLDDLQNRQSIVFNWSAVQGANAYIFTLFQRTASSRRQLVRTNPIRNTTYTLDNLGILDNGTFIWQIEPVSLNSRNVIERRGNTAESNFVLNFPLPGPVQIEDLGILYGN